MFNNAITNSGPVYVTICTNCRKSDVCKYKGKVQETEIEFTSNNKGDLPECLTVSLTCRYKE